MADKTKIEWADATLNPAYGCSKVSPACANCYALRMADRMSHNVQVCQLFEGLTDRDHEWTGRVNLFPERMEQALRWKRTRRIFVGSMTDLFHLDVPFEFLDQVFAVMALASQHTFMILTKRPERMREYLSAVERSEAITHEAMSIFERHGEGDTATAAHVAHPGGWPLPNVWLGVTAENQAMADTRIPILLDTPAAKRFVSVEPMLGPVDLGFIRRPTDDDYAGWAGDGPIDYVVTRRADLLNWVICGGETGPGARPISKEWVFSLRDQCASASVPFFFKKWGTYKGPGDWDIPAGSLVDSVEHHEIPEAPCPA